MKNCLICERIEMIKNGSNPFFVKELETGYVVIGDDQYFRGYTLFLCKQHVTEIHQLAIEVKAKFLLEMALVEEAVAKAFGAEKMNLEMLGNGDSHVHWHLFPRLTGDLLPYAEKGPVWWLPREVEGVEPTAAELQDLVATLRAELEKML